MAKKKSAAKKYRERTGTYLSKLTFHVPVSDIIDILAVLLRDKPKLAEEWTDQNSIVTPVAKFLTERGNDGMKWARKETGSTELVADHIYEQAAAIVEKHLSFMVEKLNTPPPETNNTPTLQTESKSEVVPKSSANSASVEKLTPQGQRWLRKPSQDDS